MRLIPVLFGLVALAVTAQAADFEVSKVAVTHCQRSVSTVPRGKMRHPAS